jgi:two-component system response regulator VicR
MMSDRGRILVADRDKLMREVLRVILCRAGYEVSLAEDGLQAVEMAAGENPDLVLIDEMLPDLHGYDICKAIKRFWYPPAVFVVTGSSPDAEGRSQIMRDCGADQVILKPVDYGELQEFIKKRLGPGLTPTDRLDLAGRDRAVRAALEFRRMKLASCPMGAGVPNLAKSSL